MAVLGVTNTFSSGTAIVASQMNTNFDDIEAFINTTPGVLQLTGGTVTGAVQLNNTLTLGSSGAGHDVILWGDTAGDYFWYDADTNKLVLEGANGATALDVTDGNVVIGDGTLTVGSDGAGEDVTFYSDTAGDHFVWDSSAEKLTITGTAAATALDIADGNVTIADDLDVDGTTNLDAVDIDGAVQIDGTVTVGVNDTGFDVKFFGATATNGYMLWDESTDDLVLGTASRLGIGVAAPTSSLHVSNTTNITPDGNSVGHIQITGSGYAGCFALDGDGFWMSQNSASRSLIFATDETQRMAIDGSGNITVGVDDAGYDVQMFGATAGSHLLWDQSADQLHLIDSLLVVGNTTDAVDMGLVGGVATIRGINVGTSAYNDLSIRSGSGTQLYLDTAGLVGIGREPTDSMKLDIETSNAATYCRIKITEAYSSYSPAALWIEGGANTYAGVFYGDSADPDIGSILYWNNVNSFVFTTNTAERMRIASNGSIQVGYAGDYGSLNPLMLLYPASAHGPTLFVTTVASTDTAVKFYSNTAGSPNDAGTITLSGATTTYGTTSDYRLKENVADLTDAVDRVKQLRPINFSWIKEPERGTMDGFIAHEVAEVVPQSVSGAKDAVLPAVEAVEAVEGADATFDEDGNELTAAIEPVQAVDPWPERPDPQSLDTSHLVPLLTAAIKELDARLAAVEAA